MSEDEGAQRASDEQINDSEGTEPDEQVVGDDASDYGGAGASDTEDADHVDPGGQNRPPSEQDDDQGI